MDNNVFHLSLQYTSLMDVDIIKRYLAAPEKIVLAINSGRAIL